MVLCVRFSQGHTGRLVGGKTWPERPVHSDWLSAWPTSVFCIVAVVYRTGSTDMAQRRTGIVLALYAAAGAVSWRLCEPLGTVFIVEF